MLHYLSFKYNMSNRTWNLVVDLYTGESSWQMNRTHQGRAWILNAHPDWSSTACTHTHTKTRTHIHTLKLTHKTSTQKCLRFNHQVSTLLTRREPLGECSLQFSTFITMQTTLRSFSNCQTVMQTTCRLYLIWTEDEVGVSTIYSLMTCFDSFYIWLTY